MTVVEIKEYIFDNDKIEYILEQIGMHEVKRNDKYISCAFPNGDNPNGCLIYLSKYLNVISYTREIDGKFKNLDIIDLVNYILEFNDLHKTINKIKELLNLNYSIIKNNNSFYCGNDIYKKVSKKKEIAINNEIIFSRDILDEYDKVYHISLFKKDFLLPNTLKFFDVRFDRKSDRIIFPHFNKGNKEEILALVGRTVNPLHKELNIPKYFTIKGVGYKKTNNLYGLAQNIEYIKEQKKVIIFEAEKSVMKGYQMGYRNCVSVGNHNLHINQIKILMQLGIQEIIIAFDKDVEINSLIKIYEQTRNYFNVSFIYDKYNFLDEKDSPIDKSKKLFDAFYKVRYKIKDLYNIKGGKLF